jgi:hypothetical protein
MTSKRREYHVDCRAKKSSQLLCGLRAKPATRVKIPKAMRIRGYSQSEAVNRALQMQVHHRAEKIKGGIDRRGRPAQRGATEEGGEVCGRRSDHQDAAGVVVIVDPPDRMGPGRLHAGRTRVDWVACKRRQESARAGDDAAAGPEGYLSRAEASKIGGGGFVLSDYENNSVERRRVECERISGLLDWILEVATMLEDGEEGGLSSSSFTAAADRHRRMATSNEDNQQRFMAKPLLALMQR